MSTKKTVPKKRVAVVQPECLEDLQDLAKQNPSAVAKALGLMDEALKTPFSGTGKPEPLKYLGPNIWSRRVTGVDRLVYRVADDHIDFLQARYHYGD